MAEKIELKKEFLLPRTNYGPFCLKILSDFIRHNSIDSSIVLPKIGDPPHVLLSRIFDIMLHSLGNEVRDEFVKTLDEYKMGLPAHFRN
jgi:hypothetical protein